MVPKQREMDDIVKTVYEAISKAKQHHNTLLVLCGDHGMNDGGNHGGSSPGETSPALVFISPKLKSLSSGLASPVATPEDLQFYTTVEQSDIAPTLGGLLGFPVPKNNLGNFIVDFLPLWPAAEDRLAILTRNAKQMLNIVTAAYPGTSFTSGPIMGCEAAATDAERLACRWRSINERLSDVARTKASRDSAFLKQISSWMRDAQDTLSGAASNYTLSRMYAGKALTAVAVIAAAIAAVSALKGSPMASSAYLVVTIAYGIMMFASSYVEEEQNIWYWAASGWMAILFMKQ
jgi:ethanolaminephosphotransferase